MKRRTILDLDLNIPLALGLVPFRADDLVAAVNILSQFVLVNEVGEIGEDFFRGCVVG